MGNLAPVPAVTVSTPIRVVVGEDEPLMREGVVHILQKSGFDVIGVASDADELTRLTDKHRPQVVITDIRMPPGSTDDGLEAARRIRSSHPDVAVLVLSQYLEAQYAFALLRDGAEGVGYLLKDRVADVSAFVDAVHRVAAGGSALDPEVVRRMVQRPRTKSPIEKLTRKEREVLALMAEGFSNQGIAERLSLGVAAIERHVTNLFTKLQLSPSPGDNRRVLAILLYLHALDRRGAGRPGSADRDQERR